MMDSWGESRYRCIFGLWFMSHYMMNFVVYILDSARADHFSCYGYDRDTTPVIDSVAEDGIVFENAISPSTWTRPVAASILTGLYPMVHGTRTIEDAFSPPIKTLPKVLGEAGYTTLGIESMPNIQADIGFGKGFDEYINVFDQEFVRNARRDAPQFDDGTPLTRAEDLNQVFFDWFESNSEEDFFALLWSNEPHLPFSPPEGYRGFTSDNYSGPVISDSNVMRQPQLVDTQEDKQQLIDLYDGELKYNDDVIRDLLSYLENEGVMDETVFIFVGDHGDAFNEHGHWGHGDQIPPYEEVIHVPFILKTPSSTDGVRVREPVSLVDVFPTIIDIASDVESSAISDAVQGTSLYRTNGEISSSEGDFRWVFAENCHAHDYGVTDQWIVGRSKKWKYMEFDPGERQTTSYFKMVKALDVETVRNILEKPLDYFFRHLVTNNKGSLYKIDEDPDESRDLSDEYSKQHSLCRETILEWRGDCNELKNTLDSSKEKANMDSTTIERLEQLGYLE